MKPLYLILAGGKGERLMPLTAELPKPVVGFGPRGSIIDYALYNCLTSGDGDAIVLTQHLSPLVERYLNVYWTQSFRNRGRSITVLDGNRSAQGPFKGNADAVRQAIESLPDRPELVVVLAGDHIYRMDYRGMVEFHRDRKAFATVGAAAVDPDEAHRFGIMKLDRGGRVLEFKEKPLPSDRSLGAKGRLMASMGIYVFNTDHLMRHLEKNRDDGEVDLGRHVIPALVSDRTLHAFRFRDSNGNDAFWRDVGEIPSFWKTHLDLLDKENELLTHSPLPGMGRLPFSRTDLVDDYRGARKRINRSAVARTARVGKAEVEKSVIAAGARIENGARVTNSIIMAGARVPEGMVLSNWVLGPGAVARPERTVDFEDRTATEKYTVHFCGNNGAPSALEKM